MIRHLLRTLMASSALVATVASATPATTVSVQSASVRTLEKSVTAYGKLVPDPRALHWLSAALAGQVGKVFVSAGSPVKAGQKLVLVKPTPQTLATLQDAQSNLGSARVKLHQTEKLAHDGLATKADLAAARSAMASARSRLAALHAEGASASGEWLKAAVDGVVTKVAVTPGQWVTSGARIAAVSPHDALWVRLGLPPADAARVQPGTQVTLTSVFAPGSAIHARIQRMAGQTDPATGLVDALVPISAKAANGLVLGDWVTGSVTLRTFRLPTVPRSAVLEDSNGHYVFVIRKGKARRVPVVPQVRANGMVGVSGIKPGARVVTRGNFELVDGASVRIAKHAKTTEPAS